MCRYQLKIVRYIFFGINKVEMQNFPLYLYFVCQIFKKIKFEAVLLKSKILKLVVLYVYCAKKYLNKFSLLLWALR